MPQDNSWLVITGKKLLNVNGARNCRQSGFFLTFVGTEFSRKEMKRAALPLSGK
jgi:hypothetical protein